MPLKVLFDTTVLLGAFLSPGRGGLCMDLLEFARIGVIEPIISQEVVAEWERTAKAGVNGVRYTDAELDAFCDLVAPLLSPESLEQVRLGRRQVPLHAIATVGQGVTLITQHPTRGYAHKVTHMRDERTAVLKDSADAHLFQVALDRNCEYICSSNTKDLPEGFTVQSVQCISPESLIRLVRETLDS